MRQKIGPNDGIEIINQLKNLFPNIKKDDELEILYTNLKASSNITVEGVDGEYIITYDQFITSEDGGKELTIVSQTLGQTSIVEVKQTIEIFQKVFGKSKIKIQCLQDNEIFIDDIKDITNQELDRMIKGIINNIYDNLAESTDIEIESVVLDRNLEGKHYIILNNNTDIILEAKAYKTTLYICKKIAGEFGLVTITIHPNAQVDKISYPPKSKSIVKKVVEEIAKSSIHPSEIQLFISHDNQLTAIVKNTTKKINFELGSLGGKSDHIPVIQKLLETKYRNATIIITPQHKQVS